ncbi:2OG-Fe(II) oxygenase superfamily-domain-containing protein [Talaromyces proteolyticus]|uniref:2OG-Fe(II) oxygenase superfamily-domain-containing protein n=1 Tax=Talaromyces proteolyticus TaxID=1131652 RepID=A0AAD4KZJ2_9EURO|nr:2OG-Fe(II) oxygenase superfamily-domain-containing protein [Talaromyces proteolyticus]KAH8702437.1 2OG-Fe(II) oxygenase superfamily-domain-containing protein [Talaromyces proteolyticus]
MPKRTEAQRGDDAKRQCGSKGKGEPPAWADNRTNLCDSLGWFRSLQGGSYQVNKMCLGFLLDRDTGPRTYIDDEIVITRVGGGCVLDVNGNLTQRKDQDETTRSVNSLLASKRAGIAVGLIIGNKNESIRRKLPHRYNVMAWFRVIDVWFESFNGKIGARVCFQKLDLEEPSWWALKGTEDPLPLRERNCPSPHSEPCGTCYLFSKQIYDQSWMCLQPECSAFWKLKNGESPQLLRYDASFLSSREPFDEQIQPETSLVPDILSSLSQCPDASTQKIAWRGVICPECHKCVSRGYWNGWVCADSFSINLQDPNQCQWKLIMKIPPISLRCVISDFEIGVCKRAIRLEDQLIRPITYFTRPYQRFTYTIGKIGTIVHFSANRATLGRPNGPNELYERLQKVDLGLRRYPLQKCVGTLTAHFAVNFGMPYKYVVSVDSKSFSEAPSEIMYALGRLSWATKQAVGSKALTPNELLTLGYFEKMAIGFHDDGEYSLGPTIATLSLGAKATMKIRLKDEYFRGCRRRAQKPITDDVVLPGCYKPEERLKLQEQHQRGELTTAEYDKRRMELARAVTRREGEILICLELHHGDMVVMHGSLLQKYYEHSVSSEDKLRFALTSRYINPDAVPETEHYKGHFVLKPDQIYDGQ